MRRQAIILLTVTWLVLGFVRTPRSQAWAASEAATLKSVTLSTSSTGTELVLHVDGTYAYKTTQASPDTLFIDLAGAEAKGVAPRQQWVSPVISGYELLGYTDLSGQPVVRVKVDTKRADPFIVQKDGPQLRLLYGQKPAAHTSAAPQPVTAAERTSAPLAPTRSSPGHVLVSNVSVDKGESDETFVDVATSRTATYRVTTLPSPARLVIDIDDAQNMAVQKTYTADTAVLKAVRIGQFHANDPSVVRVVADLNGNPVFDVHATPEGVRIELRPRTTANSTPVATQVPASGPKPAESQAVATAALAPAPATVSKSAPAPKPVVKEEKPAIALPSEGERRDAVKADVQSTLPATGNSQPSAAAPLPSPPQITPEALRAEHAAQTLDLGKEASSREAQGPPPAMPLAPEEAKPVYTGEPISLNLKDVDLKDFFRLIHEISGLNIIIDPNVSGSVTLVLDSVPWDQALDIVLKNERLGKALEGNVLRIAKLETLTSEQEGQARLVDARINAAPLVTIFRPINYAKAQDIAALLKTWAGGGALSRRGTVLVDTRNNTLIVSDVQSQIPIIENIVSKIDKRAKQVSIEARVVLATADFTRTLAASLNGGYANKTTTTTGVTGSGSSITIPAPTAGQPFPITTVTNATSSGFGVASIVNASANYFINATLSAAEERDQAKTISRPTIVTQNNVQGSVQQGVQVPEQTTINNTVSVQYINATLQMQVTPQVTSENNIFLIINVNNASVGPLVANIGPSINTQQATTQVLVPDGGTVVFGGITVTTRSKSATYIPLLGTIPVLGNLFKTSNVTDNDQELLFFVSPKILPG